MGPYLTTPKKEKETQNGDKDNVGVTPSNSLQIKFGACGMQGWRNTMEDSHISQISIDPNVHIFGVFDGHGGTSTSFISIGREVAYYVRDRFIDEIKKLPAFKNRQYSQALKESFIKMDEMLKTPQGIKDVKKYQAPDENQSIFGRPESDNISLYTGCTACVVLLTDTEIYCANAGDSRCVLSQDGKALDLSIDHKPELHEEKQRIEKAGGFVEENRVKGILNLSRSLGDLEYKQDASLAVDKQMITCVPELKIEKINK